MLSDVAKWWSSADVDRLQRELSPYLGRVADWRSRAFMPRGWLLYAFGSPLLLAAVVALGRGTLDTMLAASMAFAMVVVAARLLRRAALDDRVAANRRYAPVSRLPRRTTAIALVGIATFIAADIAAGAGMIAAAIQGLLAATGCHLAYPAPARVHASARAAAPADTRLHKMLSAAEQRIEAIERAALQTRSGELQARLQRIAQSARGILDLLAARPEHLGGMRRFLNVHLDSAEQVAVRYARTHRLVRNPILEKNYRAVLGQIEAAIGAHRERLMHDDVEGLDIQIAVLRKQLRDEGFA